MQMNRRDFIKSMGMAFVAIWFSKFSWAKALAAPFRTPAPAGAADPTKAPASVQKYAHLGADYKGPRKPTFTADASCKNCSFFKPDKAGDAWGKCAIIANKYVYEGGLCQTWTKKPGA